MDVVILNQSIIKQETMNQLDLIGENPNILIGCSGRISNFGGCIFIYWKQDWRRIYCCWIIRNT
ncbi:MAG: hypothetical protein RXN81_01625 [Caldisphaera sp.]